MDYKKFTVVRKAIASPFKYDLFHDGRPIARCRIATLECLAGTWYVETWFKGNPESVFIDIEQITYTTYKIDAKTH